MRLPDAYRGAPVIAADGSTVDISWAAADPTRIAVAMYRAGRWSEQTVATGAAGAREQRPLAVDLTGGRATVVAQTEDAVGRVYAISER